MVDLDVIGSVMCNKDSDRVNSWESIFRNGLHKRMEGKRFVCMMKKVMFGCLADLVVYRPEERSSVSSLCLGIPHLSTDDVGLWKFINCIQLELDPTEIRS